MGTVCSRRGVGSCAAARGPQASGLAVQAGRLGGSFHRRGWGEVQCVAPGSAGGVRRDSCPSHVRTAVWAEASASAGTSFSEEERPRRQHPDAETLLEAFFQNEQAPRPRQDLRS